MSSSHGPGLRVTTTAATGGYGAAWSSAEAPVGSTTGSSAAGTSRSTGCVDRLVDRLVGRDPPDRPAAGRAGVGRGASSGAPAYRRGRSRSGSPVTGVTGTLRPMIVGARRGCGLGAVPRRAARGGRAVRRRHRRQHRRRRLVPRPPRVPRPRLGHLHAGRRQQPGDGLGPRRRDLRHARRARRATACRRGSASATATSPPTSTAPQRLRERRAAVDGHRRDHRAPGASSARCSR